MEGVHINTNEVIRTLIFFTFLVTQSNCAVVRTPKMAIVPLLCAKPGFFDSHCLPKDNPKSIDETSNSFEITIEKLPLKEDLWLHIDIFSVADPPIEISEIFISAFNLLGQPVGRFVDYIPCLDNHQEVYGSPARDDLYLLLTRGGRSIKDTVEIYTCPEVIGQSSDEPPTQAVLIFTQPTKAFYFHYKFTIEEYKSLQNDPTNETTPASGIQIIAVLKDSNNLCYPHLFSKAHYVTEREKSVDTLMITEVPIDCHLAKGVMPYDQSSQKELMMAVPEKDYEFAHRHPELASRSSMPTISGQSDIQNIISKYNAEKYNIKDERKAIIEYDLGYGEDLGNQYGKDFISSENVDHYYIDLNDSNSLTNVRIRPADVSISVVAPIETPEALRKKKLLEQATTKAPCVVSKKDLYLECDHTLACLEYPKGCLKSRSCEFMMSYKSNKDYVTFNLVGFTTKWIAVAFSNDSHMGKDSVTECVIEDERKVNVYSSWNHKDYEKGNKRMGPKTKNLTNMLKETKGKFVDGAIHCSFKRHKRTNIHGHIFDLEHQKFFILFAVGSTADDGPDGNLIKHHWSYVVPNQINFFKSVGRNKSEITNLRIHGALMILVWMIIVPNATFLARYFKETFVKRSCCGFSIWYMLHAACMTLTVLVTIGSVFVIYSKEDSFPGKNGWDFHAVAGVVMMGLIILQIPLAILILKFNDRYKYFFINFIHGFQGHFLFLLGYAVTYHSRNKREGLPCFTDTILIPYIVFYFIIHLIISYHVCYTDFVQGKTRSRAYMIPLDIPDRSKDLNKDEPGGLGRKIVLGIFVLGTTTFATSLVGIYLTKDNEDCIALSIINS